MLAWLRTTLLQFEHLGSRASRHGIATRLFHWLTGALLIYGLVFNAEVEVLSDPAALAREIAFAFALGGLFLIRLIWIESFGGGSRLPPELRAGSGCYRASCTTASTRWFSPSS